MVRFLHTSDWQLGMTRHYFGDGAQERFSQARFDAIARLAELAREHAAEFVVVAGDVFETNQVDRRTVSKALNGLAQMPCPVFLLPGNHDPLDAGSIYRQATFEKRCPSHVRVLDSSAPLTLRAGVEIIGAPWRSKRPLEDLLQRALRDLAPASDTTRIVVAHGAVDALAPDKDNPALIELAAAERALSEGVAHYIALGDRHSRTAVGNSGRIFYSGAPEPTDFDELEPGFALLVDVDAQSALTTPLRVGRWRFARASHRLDGDADLAHLRAQLEGELDSARMALKLDLVGTLNVRQMAALSGLLDTQRDLYAALIAQTSRTELVVTPEDSDFSELNLSGFGARALVHLRELAAAPGEQQATAQDALALLIRLAGRDA
ncbi:MAG: exonuclease SbcCD subunit D [Planctomycetes bacterium]|nr:exonuclease SbcCD subunit D [Planctomycetota bacterium]